MYHKSHIRFVYSHSKSIGGHYNSKLTAFPLVLFYRTHLLAQSGMIKIRCKAVSTQKCGNLLCLLTLSHIDYSRTLNAIADSQYMSELILRISCNIRKVRTVETCRDNIVLSKTQLLNNILRHCLCGSCSERNDRHISYRLLYLLYFEIRGAEIIPPLRNAMSFVNHKKIDVHLGSPSLKERGLKPFGRDIQKFIITIGRIVQCDIYLIVAHT